MGTLTSISDLGLIGPVLLGLDATGAGLCVCDETDAIRYVNRVFWHEFLGALEERPTEFGDCLLDTWHSGRGIKLESMLPADFVARARERRRSLTGTFSFATDTRNEKWWWVTDTKLANGWIIAVAQDISGLKAEEFRLRNAHAAALEEAYTDFLTTAPNRRQGLKRGQAMFERCRDTGDGLTVALIDLDHFKAINDIYGHEVGDRALVHFARLAMTAVGPNDQFSRLGGEEFMLVSPTGTPQDVVDRLAGLLPTIPPMMLDQGETLCFTASGGLASAVSTDTWQGLLHRADMALYLAKQNGRARFETARVPGSGEDASFRRFRS